MENSDLRLRNITELLNEKFYIPSYQRGYRWTSVEVKALLKDIWEFKQNPPKHEAGEEEPFYCLQPIVVKEKSWDNKSYWEVIDGQQRLTTLFIILNHINLIEISNKPEKLFLLDYQTRNNCNVFFKDIENTELANSNIDFYYINEAHKTINKWFTDKKEENDSIRRDFRSALLQDVQIIWYEAQINDKENEESDSIDIFTRLNIGKIPLTNAELVKALFLQKGNFAENEVSLKQLQIASEWDIIEKTLQDESFWLFIYNPSNSLKYDNRIEYIFDLMKGKTKEKETYFTFYEFNKEFTQSRNGNNKPDIDAIWLKIKKYFLSFEEWYNNKKYYHMVGYLIDCGININTIKGEAQNGTKADFEKYLKEEIRKQVDCQIDDLSYKDKRIKKVLLLFNIQTILATKAADIRFPFFRYKDEKWDIEHIRSQTDKEINKSNRKDWAIDVLEYFSGLRDISSDSALNSLKKEIDKFCSEEKDNKKSEQNLTTRLLGLACSEIIKDEAFNQLYKDVEYFFEEHSEFEDKDGIGNLALLDAKTNRSYGNAMFSIKRKNVIYNDMNGVFVPISTKNVFLKSYTKKLGDVMHWTEKDAEDYCNAIKQTLTDFLPNQEKNNNEE